MRNRQGLLDLTQQETRRIRRRGDGKYMCELPQDLIIEILRRLQTKYLMRFKCVSKQWSSLIFSRYFCNSLYTATRQRRQQPRLYISLVNKENMERVLLSASSTFIDNTTCLVVDQDLSISGMGSFFLNGVRGLMCFPVRENACIYNPSTKQLLKLPKIKPDIDIIDTLGQRKYPRYYIGHDPVSDQYKILCTMVIPSRNLAYRESEHWVFALEAGGSWKKVDPPKYYHHHTPVSLGWFTSGSVVHYMALVKMYNYAVVSFDFRSEELTIALVPMKGYLIEYEGKIVFFDISYRVDGSFADVWVLEDVNVGGKKWSKKRIVLQPCQRHLVGDTITKWVVKGTTQDGKVILAPSEMRSPFYILCYDMQSNDLKKVEIKGIPHLWLYTKCCFDLKLMDESESFVYLET